MKHVVFLKAGNPYGYGYSAGEIGIVRPTSEVKTLPKSEKNVIVSWGYDKLSEAGIVRLATKSEVDTYENKPTPPPAA